MADGKVTINFQPAEYRFWRNEFEMLAERLRKEGNEMRAGNEKARLRARESQIRHMLEKV